MKAYHYKKLLHVSMPWLTRVLHTASHSYLHVICGACPPFVLMSDKTRVPPTWTEKCDQLEWQSGLIRKPLFQLCDWQRALKQPFQLSIHMGNNRSRRSTWYQNSAPSFSASLHVSQSRLSINFTWFTFQCSTSSLTCSVAGAPQPL